MLFLTAQEILRIAERVIEQPQCRDLGLIEAAAARPGTTVGGQRAYSDVVEMAAALTESLVCNHALVDGNKRLGLASLIVFLRMNRRRLAMTNDDAYEFIYAIASGRLRGVDQISAVLSPRVT